MTSYYTAKRVGDRLDLDPTPYPNHTAAIASVAGWLSRQEPQKVIWDSLGNTLRIEPPHDEYRVLLDVGSIEMPEQECRELLHHDPLLAAIYNMGYQRGWAESTGRRR